MLTTLYQALKVIKSYTQRVYKLIEFFRSLKQCQYLDQAQIELAQKHGKATSVPVQLFDSDDYLLSEMEQDNNDNLEIPETNMKILCAISNVKTRWNTTYKFWQRLLVLHLTID